MCKKAPAEDQLDPTYRRFAEARSGTIAVLFKGICNGRGWSLVHLRNLLRLSVGDFHVLGQMPLPNSEHYINDIQRILVNCHINDHDAFSEYLGGPLLLTCLRKSWIPMNQEGVSKTNEKLS